MEKPFRLDRRGIRITDDEKKELERLWPFRQKVTNKPESNLSSIKSEILDYFGVREQKIQSETKSIATMLQELEDRYSIEAVPLKGKDIDVGSDNGLMMVVYETGAELVRPSWWGGERNVPKGFKYVVLLMNTISDQGSDLLTVLRRVFHKRLILLLMIVVVATLSSLVGLIPTWLQEYIFNDVVPSGQEFRMVQIGALLLCLKMTSKGFRLFNNLVGMRLELVLGYNLSGLLIHKLLRLKPDFFERYGIGDLQQRVNSAHAFRRAVQNSLVSVLTAVIVVACNLLLVYFKTWSIMLCLACLFLTLIVPVIDSISALIETVLRLRRLNIAGIVEDSILQPLDTLKVVRSLAMEDFHFREYSDSRKRLARVEIWIGVTQTIMKSLSFVVGAIIIGILLYILGTPSALETFGVSDSSNSSVTSSQGFVMMLLAAFSTLNGAVQSFSNSFLGMLKTIPDAIRFRPIVKTSGSHLVEKSQTLEKVKSVEFINFGRHRSRNNEDIMLRALRIEKGRDALLYSKSEAKYSQIIDEICCYVYHGIKRSGRSKVFANDIEINSNDSYLLRATIVSVRASSLWISGTLEEALTGQASLTDTDWLVECMNSVGLELQSGDLKRRYDISTRESSGLDKIKSAKIALCRSLYLNYTVILVDGLFDCLDKSVYSSTLKHVEKYGKILIVGTSREDLMPLSKGLVKV